MTAQAVVRAEKLVEAELRLQPQQAELKTALVDVHFWCAENLVVLHRRSDITRRGAGADGREVQSFAVKARRREAGAVVATLWPVADASTPQLMQAFYRERERRSGTS